MPRKRNKNVSIKVTEQEYIRLKERIGASGLTQTQYAIHALLYGRLVVTGTRENIDYILRRIEEMEVKLQMLLDGIQTEIMEMPSKEMKEMKVEFGCILQTLLEIVREADMQIKK